MLVLRHLAEVAVTSVEHEAGLRHDDHTEVVQPGDQLDGHDRAVLDPVSLAWPGLVEGDERNDEAGPTGAMDGDRPAASMRRSDVRRQRVGRRKCVVGGEQLDRAAAQVGSRAGGEAETTGDRHVDREVIGEDASGQQLDGRVVGDRRQIGDADDPERGKLDADGTDIDRKPRHAVAEGVVEPVQPPVSRPVLSRSTPSTSELVHAGRPQRRRC